MDILNFISWIKAGKYSPTMPADAITVVGVPNPTRGDAYLPVTIPITAITSLIPPFPVSNTNIGKLIGGGIVVAEWDDNGVKKALVASLTNLATSLPWTIPPYDTISVPGVGAQSLFDGLTNTNAIIAQTGAPAAITYAAGIARLYLGGGYNDWYLPSVWELNICYNVAAIVNKIPGADDFTSSGYWASTETNNSSARRRLFGDGGLSSSSKNFNAYVRAVRIHTL